MVNLKLNKPLDQKIKVCKTLNNFMYIFSVFHSPKNKINQGQPLIFSKNKTKDEGQTNKATTKLNFGYQTK